MNDILTLDCTLRDGGYCNKWYFREHNIKKIISGIISAKVEIIECGFLTNKISYDKDISKYNHVAQLVDFIPEHGDGNKFVLMVNYGEYSISELVDCEYAPIDGIRVAFHKHDRYEAMEFCRKIKEKGYLVFVQPMVTMLYSDDEFKELIEIANNISPYAFYIVDSFGMMNKKMLSHYFDIVETALNEEIFVGFHSHNNLQSAFANAQSLLERRSDRTIIIDSSVYGMGRGAGNLNSELLLNELNEEIGKQYEIKPLLQIMDKVLNRFYEENPWGYSLSNYLSAIHMIHPNYAAYLSEKKTLAIEDMDEIFSMIEPEKGVEYDENYINSLYIQYMSMGVIRNEHLSEIKDKSKGRRILLIAPGKSAIQEKEKILEFIREYMPIVISINHEYPECVVDYIFVSNIRRFGGIDRTSYNKTISTSNIKSWETYASIDYFKLLNAVDDVRDNAGMMAIKFAIDDLEAKEIYLAGLDGYSHDVYENFETRDMALLASAEFLDRMNTGMKRVIRGYKTEASIEFITPSLVEISE
jgi:4-hydroxy 2-oxovalerate aldolase